MFEAIVEGYQSVEPLKIGELWALPSLLRFVLIENLRRHARSASTARARCAASPTGWPTGCWRKGRAKARPASSPATRCTRAHHLRHAAAASPARRVAHAGRALITGSRTSSSGTAATPRPDHRRAPDAVVRQCDDGQHRARPQADQRHPLDGMVREGQPRRRAAAQGNRVSRRPRLRLARPVPPQIEDLARRSRRSPNWRAAETCDRKLAKSSRRRRRTPPISASSSPAIAAPSWKQHRLSRAVPPRG